MKRGNTHRSATFSGYRGLRLETLERRELLAAVLGDGPEAFVSGASDGVSSGYVATCQAPTGLWQNAPLAKQGADCLVRGTADLGKGELTPVTDISVPETIDGPRGKNPGDFEAKPHEDTRWPLPEEVNPDMLGGPGCPLAPPSEGNREDILGTDEEWAERNEANDYSCEEGTLTGIPLDPNNLVRGDLETAHQRKRESLGYLIVGPSSDWCDPDSDGKGSDGGKVDDKGGEEDPVVDESSGKPSVDKDPEPEGDDPDELRGANVDQAMAGFGSGGGADTGLDPYGNPQRTTGERGEGLGWRVENEARPGVEDGGPDEFTSPVFTEAIDCALTEGLNASPTPEDDGSGPHPRPEFNVTQIGGQAAAMSGSSGGQSAYPRPDDDGSGPLPPPTA